MPDISSNGTQDSTETQKVSGEVGSQSSPTASPPAESDVKAPETLLDRFNSVMKGDEAGKSSTPEGSEESDPEKPAESADPAEKTGEEAAKEGELGDVTDEELKSYKPSTAKRVKQLVRERNEARDRYREAEPKIQSFEKISRFVQEAGLNKDEVNQGFEIMRLMKHDPAQALEALRPYVEQLLVVTGSILPEDLRQKVQNGEMNEATALELSRVRAQNAFLQTSQQSTVQRTEQNRVMQVAQQAGDTVTQWEQQWSQNDPDYKRKQPYVLREIERRLLKGEVPADPQQAVKMCNDIKTQVEKELMAFMPKREEIKPAIGGTQPNNRPAPKNTLEAMQQALRKAG